MKNHQYSTNLSWTGNKGKGTRSYRSYERSYDIHKENHPQVIQGSSDPNFLGDPDKFNPEELLVSSISSCHMLWYLHLCATNQIIVNSYSDHAKGEMIELTNGSGKFEKVTLFPQVQIENKDQLDLALELHHQAHEMCFIANSCNFPILCMPKIDF